ncbi:MAG: hypothetical protein AAGF71_13430 [Pseudomonadota bacterium]
MTKDELELEQIRATIANLNAETAKLQQEARFPPVVMAATILGVVAPVLTAIIALYGAQ